jgi:chorismate dehydratase
MLAMSTSAATSTRPGAQATGPVRVGAVSFLNTVPLVDGLERLANLSLRFTVPSALVGMLLRDEVEIALCSSIDYQMAEEPLAIVPAGLLGCEGSTLTVRLYSRVEAPLVGEVHCDADSHTSIMLMRILMREIYGRDPRIVEYDARRRTAGAVPVEWPESLLLIGDKVVTDAPPAAAYPITLDLGDLWHRHTGLPFVFATWMARAECDAARVATAAAALDRQRRHNRERLDGIVQREAAARGWPPDLARAYLTERLVYEYTLARQSGLEAFFEKAAQHGLIARRREIRLV